MEKYLTISKRKHSFDRLDDNNNQQLDTTDRNVDKTDAKIEYTVPKKTMKYDKTKRARDIYHSGLYFECERVFSQMKILKGRKRCKLTQANLRLSLKSFSPDKCIAFWLDGHKRHVGGHKMIMSETCPTETTEKQID